MSRKITVVRHGETDWTAAGRFCGHADIGLNAAGRAQASQLAASLDGKPLTAWSSDLRRCTETADLAGFEPILDRRLREVDFGDIEGRTWSELTDGEAEALVEFDHWTSSTGDSTTAMRRLIADFIAEFPAGKHILFTHGGPIRCYLPNIGHLAPGTCFPKGAAPPSEAPPALTKGTSSPSWTPPFAGYRPSSTDVAGLCRTRPDPRSGILTGTTTGLNA